jgi:hypothetical protein
MYILHVLFTAAHHSTGILVHVKNLENIDVALVIHIDLVIKMASQALFDEFPIICDECMLNDSILTCPSRALVGSPERFR